MVQTRRHRARSQQQKVTQVAAYIRVSTEDQAESGLGLGDQRRRVQGMAEAKGWPSPMIFEDAGISGTKEVHYRPALQQLLEAVRRGEIGAVIVLALDRLGRRTRIVLDLVEELTEHGAALISCKEQLDTSTAQGVFVLTMFAALAELERGLISERTSGALAELSHSTGETGGRMPYGYVRLPDRLVAPDPAAASVVRRIFALQRRGESTRKIADRLQDDLVVPPQRAQRWHHTAVQCVLRNREIYRGGPRGTSSHRWLVILGKAAVA
jgi:site-specific DNA recombinase